MAAAFVPVPTSFVPAFGSWRDSEWFDIVDKIQIGEPGVARNLYDAYSGLVRTLLRRQSGCSDVEDSVLSVILAAVRRLRFCDVETRQDFEKTLEILTREESLMLRHRSRKQHDSPALTLQGKSELLNSVFMQLDGTEREIVMRTCLLGQEGSQIARELSIAPTEVERAQLKVRQLYHLAHEGNQRVV